MRALQPVRSSTSSMRARSRRAGRRQAVVCSSKTWSSFATARSLRTARRPCPHRGRTRFVAARRRLRVRSRWKFAPRQLPEPCRADRIDLCRVRHASIRAGARRRLFRGRRRGWNRQRCLRSVLRRPGSHSFAFKGRGIATGCRHSRSGSICASAFFTATAGRIAAGRGLRPPVPPRSSGRRRRALP